MEIFQDYKKLADHECYNCQHLDYCRCGCPYNVLVIKNMSNGIDHYCKTYKKEYIWWNNFYEVKEAV